MKRAFLLLFCIGMMPFLCTPTMAMNFTFGDSSIYWPGYSNGMDDTTDVIGTPDIIGGGGAIVDDSGQLTTVYFNYTSVSNVYSAGDLFIDLGSNNTWDYVANIANQKVYDVSGKTISYIMSEAWASSNPGYSYRERHPVALLNPASYSSIGNFSLTSNFNSGLNPVTFNGLGIDLGGQSFTIGFAATCANDVIYERVYEPTMVVMLGGLLLGVGVLGRRQFLKR